MPKLLSTLLLVLVSLVVRPADAHGPPGQLRIDNDRNEVVQVFVDREVLGSVQPRDSRTFRVQTGRRDVSVKNARGKTLERSLIDITNTRVAALHLEAPDGQLVIDNQSGIALTVQVDGGRETRLYQGERKVLTVAAGRHTVAAQYTQHGRARQLVDTTVQVESDRREVLKLDPATNAFVRVNNHTQHDGRLLVDGKDRGRLAAGTTREITVDVGTVRLEVAGERHTLARTSLRVRAYDEKTWDARAPSEGQLTLRNRTAATLRVYVDGEQCATLRGDNSASLTLDVGRHRISLRDRQGRVVHSESVDIEPYDKARVDVGHQSLSSNHHRPTLPRLGWSVRVGY